MTAGRVLVSALTLTSSLSPAGDQAFRTLSFLIRKRGRWRPSGAGRGGAERGLHSPRPSRPDSAGRPCRPRFTDVETEAASARARPVRCPAFGSSRGAKGGAEQQGVVGRRGDCRGRTRRRGPGPGRRCPASASPPRPSRPDVRGPRVGRPPSPRMSQPLPLPRLPSSLSGLCAFEVPASPSPLIEIISTVFPEPPH